MNDAGQSSLTPFKALGAHAALKAGTAKDLSAARPRPKPSKSLAGVVAEVRAARQVEERIWLILALCGWAVLGLSLWL